MSDEYVSKVAISKAITAEALKQNLDSLYDNEASRYQRAAERIVAGMPAADIELVVRAKWKKSGGWSTRFHCSNCGWNSGMDWKYCPYCGAKMEVEE